MATPRRGPEKWEDGENGGPDTRTLLDVDLFDVSIVTYPAYSQTDASVQRQDTSVAERRHMEWRSHQPTRSSAERSKRAVRGTVPLSVRKRKLALLK